jgi:hypothetical protein
MQEIFKALNGSSPDTDLSNSITLSQYQSRETAPLRKYLQFKETVSQHIGFYFKDLKD